MYSSPEDEINDKVNDILTIFIGYMMGNQNSYFKQMKYNNKNLYKNLCLYSCLLYCLLVPPKGQF